jgi:2-polyprenyl-3-methyl-5-hydroxy-6-metoxy-1,4-benzoquinol methylase
LTVEGRAWWESKCFEAGFRKHPAYYKINSYESLNNDGWQIIILLEKVPAPALFEYPVSALASERALHMDMTRDSGERSDAHIIRYQWAAGYVKPGDRVLDAACGLGYGSHVIACLTRAATVVGIDSSDYAVSYARANFHRDNGRLEYISGFLPDALASHPNCSFDTIISFETLEHVEAPVALLSEFNRLLTPGGRIIVSVPNDWSDETGEDPNPFHLHVYDWARLKSELSVGFILENAYAQTASQCKIRTNSHNWERRPRALRSVDWGEGGTVDCEWWLMSAMKSPLNTEDFYKERVFANLLPADHPSTRYEQYFGNPFLMHSMVNYEYRLRDSTALAQLAAEVMSTYPVTSSDYSAALCVRAYNSLGVQGADLRNSLIGDIDKVISSGLCGAMALRWKVSLLFVKAKLLQGSGELRKAKDAFIECSHIDVREFGIHLATKTTEAAYLAGKISYSLGQESEAKECWSTGVSIGEVLLEIVLPDVLINAEFPNLFNHGDGVREYAVAWDNIARCANGLHLLNLSASIDYQTLDNCQQSEYSIVTANFVATLRALNERLGILDRIQSDMQKLTEDLVRTRHVLVERTDELVQTRHVLVERTDELVQTRHVLVERTDELVQARAALTAR